MDHLERNLEKAKLQYIEEHLRCDHYCQGDKSSLAIYELDTDECLVREHIMRSAIFFVTKGQISLASMKDDNLIPAGHFYLKPAGSHLYCKAEEPSTIIRMSLDVDITFCNKLHIRDLKNHLTKPSPPHQPVRERPFWGVSHRVEPLSRLHLSPSKGIYFFILKFCFMLNNSS